MAASFSGTAGIDRPINDVFAFLANGENDPKFSPRVLEIAKTTEGPPGVGTIYASTVKDAGMKTQREFKLIEFEPPTKIRWAEKQAILDSPGAAALCSICAAEEVPLDEGAEGEEP